MSEQRNAELTHIAHCPECDRTVTKDSTEDVIETVENHNEQRHAGERVAGIGPTAMPIPSDEVVEAAQEVVERVRE